MRRASERRSAATLRPRPAAGVVGVAPGPFVVETVQPLHLGRRAFAVGDDRGLAVPVAALEAVDHPEALLERGQGGRIVLDGLGQ